MKHTKGPWHLHAGVMGNEFGVWSPNDAEKPIAVVRDHNNKNAHLIAAAPEMLEALETLLTSVEFHGDYLHEKLNGVQEAREAIRKAKGEV